MKLYTIKYKILKNNKIITETATSFLLSNDKFIYSNYSTGEQLEYKTQNIKILNITELEETENNAKYEMFEIGKEFYIIKKRDLEILKIKICKITIMGNKYKKENDVIYDYTYADNEIHFNSLWNTEYLRENGKLLKFETEEQAKEYLEHCKEV